MREQLAEKLERLRDLESLIICLIYSADTALVDDTGVSGLHGTCA